MENETKIGEIDQVIMLLQQLNIPASYDNMSKLMTCLQLLASIKVKLTDRVVKEDQNGSGTDEQ